MDTRRAVIALALVSSLGGCIEVDGFLERWHKGTSKGYQYCEKAGQKQGLSTAALREVCADRHEHPLFVFAEGRATYRTVIGDNYSFSGSVKNTSTDTVITRFTVIIRPKKGTEERHTFGGRFIEPGQTSLFTIAPHELRYQPTKEEVGTKEYFTWDVTEERGIKIEF
jgi:hypothetical protein